MGSTNVKIQICQVGRGSEFNWSPKAGGYQQSPRWYLVRWEWSFHSSQCPLAASTMEILLSWQEIGWRTWLSTGWVTARISNSSRDGQHSTPGTTKHMCVHAMDACFNVLLHVKCTIKTTCSLAQNYSVECLCQHFVLCIEARGLTQSFGLNDTKGFVMHNVDALVNCARRASIWCASKGHIIQRNATM